MQDTTDTMTTETTARVCVAGYLTYAIIEGSNIRVVAGKHDYEGTRRVRVDNFHSGVALSASDATDHATFYMTLEEARVLAQAILDVTD